LHGPPGYDCRRFRNGDDRRDAGSTAGRQHRPWWGDHPGLSYCNYKLNIKERIMAEFEQDDFLGKGWGFPPTFIPATQGVEMTEKVEDINRSLQILLTTRVGERIMQPKYGCNMDEMVFESLSTTTKTIIKDKIKTAILYFEPRIDVTTISMDTTNELEGEIIIEIEYVVRATNNRFNFVFPYYINEGTELNFMTIDNSSNP
jgi:uncharacterized protein